MSGLDIERYTSISKRHALYLFLILAAAALPLALWQSNWAIIGNTYGKSHELFEIFAFTTSAALIIAGTVELRRLPNATFQDLLPLLSFLFVAFNILTYFVEHSSISWDYRCYENAARNLLQNSNPYSSSPETCYLYPPLLAQGLALAYRLLRPGASWLAPETEGWYVLFYLYQSLQYLAVLLTFNLSYRLARLLGLSTSWASLLVAALLLLNNPLIRTIRHNQVNLWMLDLFLLAVLLLPRAPYLAGLSIAFSIHLKLFTLVLLPIWTLARQWRAVTGTLLSLAFIFLIQTDFGRRLDTWSQFITFYRSQPLLRFMRFRNNSIQSVVYGSLQRLPLASEVTRWTAGVLIALATVAVFFWLIRRYLQRNRLELQWLNPSTSPRQLNLVGHSLDALALTLITAPITWEHHYVLAVPLVIWAAAVRGRAASWLIGLSALLMLGLPTFDIFPFSYHRLVGLLLWLQVTRPGVIQSQTAQEKRESYGT